MKLRSSSARLALATFVLLAMAGSACSEDEPDDSGDLVVADAGDDGGAASDADAEPEDAVGGDTAGDVSEDSGADAESDADVGADARGDTGSDTGSDTGADADAAASPGDVVIELTWHNPDDPDESDDVGADVDLHLVKMGPGKWFDTVWDIYFRNPNNRNEPGDLWGEEDPRLSLDDSNGAGPERIVMESAGELALTMRTRGWW